MRILIAEPENFSEKALATLRTAGRVECRAIRQRELKQAMGVYDVIWIRLGLEVAVDDVPVKPRCRYIVTATTGIDHLDLDVIAKAGMKCISLRGHDKFLKTISSTAELALGLLISLVRNIPSACASVLKGNWNRDGFRGIQLEGLTIGIVGCGRLGRKLASYCNALGLNVLFYDPYVEGMSISGIKVPSLDLLLKRSDIVSLHVKLTEETSGMIGRKQFAIMKKGAYLVNTSRGDVIVESALLSALKSGHLAGAALDVLSGEPGIDGRHVLVSYARKHNNLIITPHIGGATADAMAKCEDYLAEVLVKRFNTRGRDIR